MRIHRTPVSRTRVGATLTEVLMALLVTGIGLTSVMYLFPLSLQRAIQANQITNATLLRINAAARLKTSIGSLQIPGGGGVRGGNSFNYAIVKDPDDDGDVLEHEGSKFIFDPLGVVVQASDNPPLAGAFGWIDGNNNQQFDGAGEVLPIPRYTFGYGATATPAKPLTAQEFVTLTDSFITLADVLGGPTTAFVSGTTLNLPGENLTEYVTTPATAVRVTLINSNGKSSVLAPAALITGAQTIDLLAATTVPAGFEIGRVTVELPERRFTWLATVRRIGTKPSVTVVVFFRRSFAAQDERVWIVNEPAGGYNEFEITVPAGAELPAGLKVGGWMFDMNAFRWLKVASVQEVGAVAGGTLYRYTTDPEEEDPSPAPRIGIPVMFPRGVVEAYTLKKD